MHVAICNYGVLFLPQYYKYQQTNTYQAIAITDGFQSYAVYTYRCGDLQWSGGATIGYNGGPIGNFSENHPLSGDNANSIACINTGVTEYSNVVYNVSIDDYISTDSPPTIEPRRLNTCTHRLLHLPGSQHDAAHAP